MKVYNISVRVSGCEYYTVTAESEEDAISQIKDGCVDYGASEVEWCGKFSVDSVEEED